MTDHRRKSKRVLRRDRPRKPRRPPIPAPKIESGTRPERDLSFDLDWGMDDAERGLLDAEFDEKGAPF